MVIKCHHFYDLNEFCRRCYMPKPWVIYEWNYFILFCPSAVISVSLTRQQMDFSPLPLIRYNWFITYQLSDLTTLQWCGVEIDIPLFSPRVILMENAVTMFLRLEKVENSQPFRKTNNTRKNQISSISHYEYARLKIT